MEMIYYAGIGKSYTLPEKIDLSKEVILSYEIKKLPQWKSPDLIIIFKDKKNFQQPAPLIVNYNDVIKYLKKLIKKNN